MIFSENKSNWAQNIRTNCLCTGCGLCQSIDGGQAIVVNIDSKGYIRPNSVGAILQEEETKLDYVCPGCHVEHDIQNGSIRYDVIWGPLIQSRIGYAADPEIRFLGSSGGVVSALATYLLETGKVDYVLHTIASPSTPLLNSLQYSRSRSDVLASTGSRYSPSSPLIDFESCLARPEKFAFIGKPCDVAAIHNYAKLDRRVNEKMVYAISFMCAGIPSLNGTAILLKQLGLNEADVKSLRYRGQGWPGSMVVETMDGAKHSMDYERSWGFLSKHLQFRCKVCPDGVGEFADISCGDAWYLRDQMPVFSEQDGRSVVMSRTERGEQLIQDCNSAGYLTLLPMQESDLSLMQPYQAMRKKLIASRLLALKVLGVQTPKYVNLHLGEAAKQAGLRANIGSFFGTFARVFLQISSETPQLHGFWKIISGWLARYVRKLYKR